jgi:Cdc6-like AAA superfamily ATPase
VSQAIVTKYALFEGRPNNEVEAAIGERFQLKEKPGADPKEYENKLQNILRDISGNNLYRIEDDPGYVLNIDNFIKICLISYKMKVNIPLVIQGEAGIGKTALLRHLINNVFEFTFLSHTINAGVTEALLESKIE